MDLGELNFVVKYVIVLIFACVCTMLQNYLRKRITISKRKSNVYEKN